VRVAGSCGVENPRKSRYFHLECRRGTSNHRHIVPSPHSQLIGVSRQVSWEEFDRTLNLNLRASFILTKELIAPMREQRWGRIVFVSSIAAQGGGINGPHYAASKGGLTGLMKNLSTRLAEFNISVTNLNSPADSKLQVNDVAPAMIEETGMIPSDEAVGGIRHKIPLGRYYFVLRHHSLC
jgi:NAD(P)-dependent dehydrogenase (short-subunit alcohol dehydrogenase family)